MMLRLVAVLLLLAGCQPETPAALNGYVETEPLRLAAAVSGRITGMNVNKGDTVEAGQILFTLDATPQQAQLDEAHARLQQADAQAADLSTGKRPAELASLQAGLNAAQVSLHQAETELARQQKLARQGYSSATSLDSYRTQRDTAAANVRAAEAQIRAAQLAGRDQARLAAAASSTATAASLAQANWALAQTTVTAPQQARVENRYYQAGEWVAAGSPVLSLLDSGQYKIRFYVPQTRLGGLQTGQALRVQCDGCPEPVAATIRFIAPTPEFTPPVLYTREQRARLVYLVEAYPADTGHLHPGQPVDVWLDAP